MTNMATNRTENKSWPVKLTGTKVYWVVDVPPQKNALYGAAT